MTAVPERARGDAVLLVRSAGAATLSALWRLAVTFATYLVLRRLVPPAEMGVWSWAEPLFLLLAQVRDLGVPGHVVRQRERDYAGYLRLQLVWGGVLAVVLFAAAPFLALLFEDRDASTVPILRLLCVFLFVQGIGSVPLTYFEAEQRIERTIPAELLRNALFAALSLLLAWRGLGVWSIVVAYTAAGAAYSATLWWWATRRGAGDRGAGEAERPRLRVRGGGARGAARALAAASWPLMVMSLLENAVLNLDPLLLGLVDEEATAYAALTLFSLFFFSRLIADQVGRALYPALVVAHARPAESFELYRVATLFLVTFVVPASFFFFFNARAAALLLGGPQWVPAGDYLTVAAFVPFVRPLTMFGREYLLVVHQDRLVNVYSFLNLVSLGALGWILVHGELGALGMAVAGYFPLGVLPLAWGLRRIDRAAFGRLLRQILGLYALGAALFAPVAVLPEAWTWTRVTLSVALAGLSVALGLGWHRQAYRRFWRGDGAAGSQQSAVGRPERT
jgi:O-antigen/teichoic acid export membrane protein